MRTRGTGRPLRAAIVGAIAAAALLAPRRRPQAACGGVQHFRRPKLRRPGAPPLAIGDSVMLGAVDPLAGAGFEVDVRGCRQMSEGLGVLRAAPGALAAARGRGRARHELDVSPGRSARALRILGPEPRARDGHAARGRRRARARTRRSIARPAAAGRRA